MNCDFTDKVLEFYNQVYVSYNYILGKSYDEYVCYDNIENEAFAEIKSAEKILNLYGKIEFPYKEKMNEWIGKTEIYCVTDFYGTGEKKFVINGGGVGYIEFSDIDEALKKFNEVVFSDKNIAIKQTIWNAINPDKDPDSEEPDEMEKEVKDINIKDYE